MIYDTLKDEGYDEQGGVAVGLETEGLPDFAPLLELGEAEKFSALVYRLEGAGIPWFVENAGAAAVLYVTLRCLDEARQLVG